MQLQHRYVLHAPLGSGSMGVVYQATDRLTGQRVALKRVRLPVEHRAVPADPDQTAASADVRLALVQEFKILASLRHPHIISVLDYGFDDAGVPFFTMEYLRDARPLVATARTLPNERSFVLLFQMLNALAYLHRRGVLHRDLKPANVVVSENAVKLLDFGLSLLIGHDEPESRAAAGTLSYMAPEVMLGEGNTPAADLYAVGVMAYEIFAGEHPFNDHGLVSLPLILHGAPDLSRLPVALQDWIGRLLAKSPDERYPTAADAITALGAVTDQQVLAAESAASRESYLQAARLVGRTAELGRLSQVLAQTVAGHGGVWLVGGESGVGKSRLLDEVRTLALVRGVAVMSGQAIAEGGAPYTVWRGVLRALALSATLDDLEAGVFKSIVADLETLLDRAVPDAPPVDPPAAQLRLVDVVAGVLRRLSQPTLIVLEDLHWADSNSLALISALVETAAGRRLLIVGSYRDDERANLPGQIGAGVQVLELKRLTERDLISLSEAMFGRAGLHAPIVSLLQRETEGNVFFAIEVARALVEEAGGIDRIGEVTLPRRVFSGGVQQVIRRRLARVPAWARPLLAVAAAVGRQLDLPLLQVIDPSMDLTQWLAACDDAAVLEVQEARWRFAHDKLRDGLLADLLPDESRRLYAEVAGAIETLYAGERERRAAALAYYWAQAGDEAREARYAVVAGAQALGSGAFNEARTYLERARDLFDVSAMTPLERAQVLRQLGEAAYGVGDLPHSRAFLEAATRTLGLPMPAGGARLALLTLRHIVRQLLHRALPAVFARPVSRQRERLLEITRIGMQQAEVAFFNNDGLMMLGMGFRAFNAAERAGVSPELVKTYANMCFATSASPLSFLSPTYKRLTLQTVAALGEVTAEDFALRRLALFDTNRGNWDAVESVLAQARALEDRIGNPFVREENLNMRGSLSFARGDYDTSKRAFADEYELTLRTGSKLHQAWGLLGQGENALRQGQFNEAAMLLQASLNLLLEHDMRDVVTLIQAYGMLGAVALRQGREDAARQYAGQALDLIASADPSVYALLEGYAGTAEVFLALLEAQPDAADLRQLADAACLALRRLGGVIPIAQPRALTLSGWQAALAGKRERAERLLDQSAALAESQTQPYERALTLYHRGRLLNDAAAAEAARALFLRLGAADHPIARAASAG